jgi:hypothetical protein
MSATEHEGITGITFDSDGHRLVGVLYLARGDGPKPTALLLHGCPGLEKNLDLAVVLRDRGWNSLVFHYRGCWGSAGRYDLRTIPSDVAAAVGCLAGHPLVDPDRITAVGHSMGGWAAIVAADHAFSWHRAALRDLIGDWLDKIWEDPVRSDLRTTSHHAAKGAEG